MIHKTAIIDSKAKIAEKKPTKKRLGKAESRSNATLSNTSTGSTKLIFFAEKLAIIDAIEIPAKAFIEKCLITTSWAKIIPAIGDPKPAEIAAATPAPIIMS